MKNLGFTLIELILGMTITAAVSVVIFITFYQTQKSAINLDKMISVDARIGILQNQFEKDITGAFVPNTTEIKGSEKTEKTEKETKQQQEEKPQKEKKEEKKLEKIFYSANQNKNLKELTFITANPLQVYGQAQPRIARVIYRLKEDKKSKGSFVLTRQETNKLEYGAQKGALEYELINGIKDFKIEYKVPIKKAQDPEKEKKEQTTKEKKPQEFKTFYEWEFADKPQKDEKEMNFIIPQFANVKVTLWQENETGEQTFEFKYFIYAFDSQFQKIKTQQERTGEKLQGLVSTMEELRKGLPPQPGAQPPQPVKK